MQPGGGWEGNMLMKRQHCNSLSRPLPHALQHAYHGLCLLFVYMYVCLVSPPPEDREFHEDRDHSWSEWCSGTQQVLRRVLMSK